jgi:hypothetical protein
MINASTIKCWELSTPQAGARRREGCCTFHYPLCTDSNKPSLQFSFNFVLINASEGSLCFHISWTVTIKVIIKTKVVCYVFKTQNGWTRYATVQNARNPCKIVSFLFFITSNSRCQVQFGSFKKLPVLRFSVVIFGLVLRDHWCQHY